MGKEVILKTEGLVGFVEAFREVTKKSGIQKGDIVIFSGCPGSCFPTVSDFAFAIQDLGAIMYWVPDADLDETRKLEMVENVGMQACEKEKPPTKCRGLVDYSSIRAAWAAASRAIGTRNGEQET